MHAMVRVRYLKWPDRPHWAYDMVPIGEDDFGMWLWAPAGTVARRGDEPPEVQRHSFIELVPREEWLTAIWNAGGKYEIYVDVNTPPQWEGATVRMIDLDLDVVKARDGGAVATLDEDEFAVNRRTLGYPADVVAEARATADRINRQLSRRVRAPAAVAPAWFARGDSL